MNNLRVLLVDDNESFGLVMRGFLENHHVDVVGQARNGLQAIAYARIYSPDLVLLDISMPGMNGIQIARYLKTAYPMLRIVFLSLHDEDAYRDVARTLHLDGFVSKSDVVDQLPEMLHRVSTSVGLDLAMTA